MFDNTLNFDTVETHIEEIYTDVVHKMGYPVENGSDLDALITELIYTYAQAKDKNSSDTSGWTDSLILDNIDTLTDFHKATNHKSIRNVVETVVDSMIDDISASNYESRYSVNEAVFAKENEIYA